MTEIELMDFDTKKTVATAKVEMNFTENDIDIILSNGLAGGIGYWAKLHTDGEKWDKKPNNRFTSEWATRLILDGETIEFSDAEEEEDDDEVWSLSLVKLMKGFELNYVNRPFDNDIQNGDATTSDCIIQYALFGKLIYG